jgi:hypothetical protein
LTAAVRVMDQSRCRLSCRQRHLESSCRQLGALLRLVKPPVVSAVPKR